jgi:hypothetical protein
LAALVEAIVSKDDVMPVQIRREDEVFRMIVGVVMVAAIVFGVLELMNVIHV